jgi:hypothetical protein
VSDVRFTCHVQLLICCVRYGLPAAGQLPEGACTPFSLLNHHKKVFAGYSHANQMVCPQIKRCSLVIRNQSSSVGISQVYNKQQGVFCSPPLFLVWIFCRELCRVDLFDAKLPSVPLHSCRNWVSLLIGPKGLLKALLLVFDRKISAIGSRSPVERLQCNFPRWAIAA